MEVSQSRWRLLAVGSAGVAVAAFLFWRRRKRGLRISKLIVYPIKSCRGHELSQACLTSDGLAHDREYAVVETSSGGNATALTQRDVPLLAVVFPDMPDGDGLIVRKSGMRELVSRRPASPAILRIKCVSWGADEEVDGEDMGDDAGSWFSEALQRPNLRLVRFSGVRPSPEPTKYGPGTTRFSDGFSMLLVSEASLAKFEEQTDLKQATERTRPNIVVKACTAHEEDTWPRLFWRSGAASAELRLVKPCARCTIPRVNPDTGAVGPDPMKALRCYRAGKELAQQATAHQAHYESNRGEVFFGQNVIPVLNQPAVILRRGHSLAFS